MKSIHILLNSIEPLSEHVVFVEHQRFQRNFQLVLTFLTNEEHLELEC